MSSFHPVDEVLQRVVRVEQMQIDVAAVRPKERRAVEPEIVSGLPVLVDPLERLFRDELGLVLGHVELQRLGVALEVLLLEALLVLEEEVVHLPELALV